MIRLVREEEVRWRVEVAFGRRRVELERVLPGARVEHVGSTAVPGSLTKGDLDICVIVAAEEFEAASRILAGLFEIHQPENWSPTLASFTAPPEDGIDVGVQLVPAGSADERHFVGWRDRLRADAALRARYDDLKHRHATGSMDAYRAAKERLILGLE
ncbi:MAG TPA: GrpB family protein [Solirubrobacterales bacterium]